MDTKGKNGPKFVEVFLSNPHLIVSLILLACALGFIAFKSMPLNLFPDANYPSISVILPWPGAAASDVEDKVTRVVEKELSTIDLVRKVRSVSQDEMAAVSVEFEYAKGLDAAALDVANVIKRIESRLPKGVKPAEIFRVSDATKPVFTIAITTKDPSHLDLEKIRQLADNEIREEFLRIKEVANVEVFGGYFPEVAVEVHPDRLRAYNMSIENVIAALSRSNVNIPDGLITRKDGQYLLKTQAETLKKSGLGSIVIGLFQNGQVHLRDVATIKTTFKERQSLFRGNEKAAIGINILRPEKGHVTTTIKAVEKALPEIKAKFPELNFEIADTPKNIIETSISNMVDALRDAIVMTVGVIFLILANVRISLLAAISIPFTYFLTFAVMHLFGYELNIVTLTAVIVAVGLLLDDAIVVIENIERHFRQLGKPIYQAVVDGLNEIFLADWSGTYTTVIVLVPIMFIGGYVQKILRQFTVVLSIALLASFIISVTIIPLVAPYLVKNSANPWKIEKIASLFGSFVVDPIRDFFARLCHFAMDHKLLFILPGIILFIISVRLVMPLAGRDLMPPMDTGIVKIAFETFADSSIDQTEEVAKRLETILTKMPGLFATSVTVGSEPGVVSFGTGRIPQQGMITAHFIDRFHREKSIWQMEDEIRKEAAKIPGLRNVDVFDFGVTPLSSIAAPIDVMISGPDPKILDNIGKKVEKRLWTVRGLTSVSRSWHLDKTEFLIKINLEEAKRYGLDPTSISSQVASAVKGMPASVLRVPGEDGYTIRVRYPEKDRDSPTDILSMYLKTGLGQVQLRQLASIKKTKTRTRFTRQDLQPTLDVYAYKATASITHLQERIKKALADIRLPLGYTISHEGEVKNMKEAGKRLAKALGLAVILLYFSLAATFKSWINPLTIMVAIPLSTIGAAWGLLLVGRHACMPANMGMILLAGVVVNNAILLIDFIEQARSRGVELRQAIEQSVRIRTRPILMTAFSTIVGMIPIAAQWAVGLERLSPLAVVAIGGLFVSTFLTLVYVPIFYELLDGVRQRIKGRLKNAD